MIKKELNTQELEAWIAEHVMGWKILPSGWFESSHGNIHGLGFWHPTTDPSHAMDVLKKCAEKQVSVRISKFNVEWVVISNLSENPSKAETLELAICMFAKQLFSKESK